MAERFPPDTSPAERESPSPPLLSILMPAYNEADTIDEILRRVTAVDLDKEVIVVNDGSDDGTRERLRAWEKHPGLTVLHHQHNRGKGAALRTGFARVRGQVTLIQDADLEYDPRDYPTLLAPILDGRADAVYGSRFLGGPHRVHLFWHRVGNWVVTALSNILSDLNLTDMETGYKVVRTKFLRRITIESDRFGIEPELTAKLAHLGCRIYEVPISYSGRGYSEGKKIGWKDGFSAVYAILRFNLRRG